MRELPRSMQETDCLRCRMCACRRIWSFSSSPVSMIGMRQRLQRARSVFITEADLPELPEGQFYIRDLIGMEVEEQGGSFSWSRNRCPAEYSTGYLSK